jgi:hypothetical protein
MMAGSGVEHARAFAGWDRTRRPADTAVAVDHLLRAGIDVRVAGLAEDDKWFEVFDHVAGVQVHGVVGLDDDVVEQVVGEAFAPRTVRSAREDAVQILAVFGVGVDAALEEAGPIE